MEDQCLGRTGGQGSPSLAFLVERPRRTEDQPGAQESQHGLRQTSRDTATRKEHTGQWLPTLKMLASGIQQLTKKKPKKQNFSSWLGLPQECQAAIPPKITMLNSSKNPVGAEGSYSPRAGTEGTLARLRAAFHRAYSQAPFNTTRSPRIQNLSYYTLRLTPSLSK